MPDFERNGMLETNAIYQGDCLEVMAGIEDGAVDMILCDLPYGTTACKWDSVIPFEPLWEQYKRVVKRNGAIVLTASQPFTTDLICSNRARFKYCWSWIKSRKVGALQAKQRPMIGHEDIIVFCDGQTTYNRQMQKHKDGGIRTDKYYGRGGGCYGRLSEKTEMDEERRKLACPTSDITHIACEFGLHPTQKPVALFEYLIRTYTNEGETVLDNCAGSGTTGLACLNSGRNFILIEKEPEYCEIARERMALWNIPLIARQSAAA